MNDLTSRPLEKADFDYIVSVIDRWWGGPTSALAHPIYFYELGQLARVVEFEGRMVGFLFGFVAPDGLTGYVHLVGIHPDFRRRGVARLLYSTFETDCKKAGAKNLKAITTMGNEGSVRFHEAVGWRVKEVEHYAGPDRHRIVFTKSLAEN
ncbi:MAG TPA: GNAT family N-acetyltransferase [Polyangium sp.]|nr:GNAT family N-acetyltransferase [Polyangium sp.]